MPRVDPFSEQYEPALQPFFQHRAFYSSPLFEEIVLRMHSLRDEMASALKGHLPVAGEMNANVRAVNFLFDNQRIVGNDAIGFILTKMRVVVRSRRSEEMRGSRVFDEFVV